MQSEKGLAEHYSSFTTSYENAIAKRSDKISIITKDFQGSATTKDFPEAAYVRFKQYITEHKEAQNEHYHELEDMCIQEFMFIQEFMKLTSFSGEITPYDQ